MIHNSRNGVIGVTPMRNIPWITRRTFLGTSGGASLALALPMVRRQASTVAQHCSVYEPDTGLPLFTLHDPQIKALAHTALEAATQAGASYADVRLTYVINRSFNGGSIPTDIGLQLGLSARALVNGYWGWAGTPYLAASEAPRVGREAALLAKMNAAGGQPRHVELGSFPVISDGTWRTPIQIDPFNMAIEEISDWMAENEGYIDDLIAVRGQPGGGVGRQVLNFEKGERVFASTDGTYVTQTVYLADYKIIFGYKNSGGAVVLPRVQGGWEYLRDAQVHERVRVKLDEIDHAPPPPPIRTFLDVGRYDILFSANSMAALMAATFAPATQVDRALGYEANAGGTSYLGPDIMTQLGTPVAAPMVTITADRSQPQGLATIQWDDEGVVPEDFTLVKDGVLVDYQTTREQAAWLAPWYQKQGKPIRSHGCAAAQNALSITMQHTPNLTLQPGPVQQGLDDIRVTMEHGLIVDGVGVNMDFQNLNGLAGIGGESGSIFEVRHGKVVAQIYDPQLKLRLAIMFHTPELWKSIIAMGGPASVERNFLASSMKGEPSQQTQYSSAAVPALIKQLAVIDPLRKA